MATLKENLDQLLDQILKNRIQNLEILGRSGSVNGKIFEANKKISSLQAKLLAKAISENTSLEKIIINDYRHFNLDAWKEIAEALKNHPKLGYLELLCCNFPPEGIKMISVVVASSQTLRHLDLSSNNLDCDEITPLADALINSQSLRRLDLQKNTLRPEAAQILSRVIARSRLEYLDISQNPLGPTGGSYIAEGVAESRHLRTLVAHSSQLGSAGVKAIADAAASSRTLEDLILINSLEREEEIILTSSFEEPSDSPDHRKAALGEALARCKNLRQLYFSVGMFKEIGFFNGALNVAGGGYFGGNNYLKMAGARSMATLMMRGETLEVLRLNKCHLGLDGVSAIFRALQHNRSLTCLEIAMNLIYPASIDDKTMQEMIRGVTRHPNLLALNIASSHLSDRYAKGLAEIVQNGNLHQLDLSGNALGLEAARAIAEVLPKSSLQSLNMARNHLYDKGAKVVAEGVRHTQCLRDLYLFSNQLSTKGGKAVLDALADSQLLQCLDMGDNNLCYDPLLFEGLTRCRNLETLDVSLGRNLGSLLIKLVERNRNLQQVNYSYHRSNELLFEKGTNDILLQNRERQAILRSNWARVSTLMAFERANHNSALRHSVLPLLPEILKMIGYKLPKP